METIDDQLKREAINIAVDRFNELIEKMNNVGYVHQILGSLDVQIKDDDGKFKTRNLSDLFFRTQRGPQLKQAYIKKYLPGIQEKLAKEFYNKVKSIKTEG